MEGLDKISHTIPPTPLLKSDLEEEVEPGWEDRGGCPKERERVSECVCLSLCV